MSTLSEGEASEKLRRIPKATSPLSPEKIDAMTDAEYRLTTAFEYEAALTRHKQYDHGNVILNDAKHNKRGRLLLPCS